jgi:hypothetical protein
MNIVERIVNTFIMVVGITQPTPRQKHVATIFIATGLVGAVVMAVALFALLLNRIATL